MKKSIKLFFVLLLAVGVSSCMKDNSYSIYDGKSHLEKEAPILKEYVETTEGLEGAILDETGIWYKIVEEGALPERDDEGKLIKTDYYEYNFNSLNQLENPRISYSYKGQFLDGKEFDRGTTEEDADDKLPSAYNNNVIGGWNLSFLPKKAITKEGEMKEVGGLTELGLQKGTIIRVIMPSPYAYQDMGKGEVPPNTPLDFTIEVFKVLPPLPYK